jgi:flagellar biosynthesis protein FlhG
MATDAAAGGELSDVPHEPTREDLYAVLGLEPGATSEQVERAYRFCLELYGEGALATYSLLEPAEAEAQRARVREAYEVLSEEQKRQAYDSAQGYEPPAATLLPLQAASATREAPELPAVLTGADLRRIREARGVSLRHIASITKIGLRFLEYIEEERFAMLPAPVYLRGFLQEYARLVGIDPRRTADAYLARVASKA